MAKGFYVSIVRGAGAGRKVGLLLGPYASEEAARGHVIRASRLAAEMDPRAHWDSFGVVALEREGPLPRGVLNDRIELEGEIGA